MSGAGNQPDAATVARFRRPLRRVAVRHSHSATAEQRRALRRVGVRAVVVGAQECSAKKLRLAHKRTRAKPSSKETKPRTTAADVAVMRPGWERAHPAGLGTPSLESCTTLSAVDTLSPCLTGWPTGLYRGGVLDLRHQTAAARRPLCPERCAGAGDGPGCGGEVMCANVGGSTCTPAVRAT